MMLGDDLYFFNFDGNTIKSVAYDNNCMKFYGEMSPILNGENSSTPLYTINLPAEEFLDQAKTEFVNEFIWSNELYPDSENPTLNGKPVLVLAVKTNADSTIKYSFVDLKLLSDVYDVKNADGNSIVTNGIANIPCATNDTFGVSKPDGNTIEIDSSGVLHSIHADLTVDSENGAHDIRYYHGKLQYNNEGTWTTLSIADLLV